MTIDTPKIRQNADLINAFSGCPFGNPIQECPFIPFYELKDEHQQIMQIEVIPQEELDRMRTFHRDCVQNYHKREQNS